MENSEITADAEVIEGEVEERTEIVPVTQQSAPLVNWEKAAEIGIAAKKARDAIIMGVLKKKADFDTIPGCGTKPVLLKPGAEKIADALNLCDEYEELKAIEDFDKPLFHYRIRCSLVERNTRVVVATGIGSCNSMEDKYRWRKSEQICPECGKAAIIKGKAEYGGGWLCFKKKGGCGEKFNINDPLITDQKVGRVANDDIFSLVNTISKMGQKRAKVAAVLNLGFSEQFTQDMDDNPSSFGGGDTKTTTQKTTTTTKTEQEKEIKSAEDVCETIGKMKKVALLQVKQQAWINADKSDYTKEEAERISKSFEARIAILRTGSGDNKITSAQAQRLYAIGATCQPTAWTHDAIKAHIKEKYGCESAKDLTQGQYDETEKFISVNEANELADDFDKVLNEKPSLSKAELIVKLTELCKVKELDVNDMALKKYRTSNLDDLASDQLAYLIDMAKGK